jgi:hypothetical protein
LLGTGSRSTSVNGNRGRMILGSFCLWYRKEPSLAISHWTFESTNRWWFTRTS